MGRAPCCDKSKVKRGPWSPEEDETLKNYIHNNGTGGNWIALPNKAGLKRCGKSCRLRWLNYLRPDIKHGSFTPEEDTVIFNLYNKMGSRWSVIASELPGRTDNDVKNHWNTKLKKKLMATQQQSSNFTSNPHLQSSISTPLPANLTPKIEAYNPKFSTFLNNNPQHDQVMKPLINVNFGGQILNNNNSTQEGSIVSDSSWLAPVDNNNYGILMDFETGISNDFMNNCIWNHQDYETIFEEFVNLVNAPTNSYVSSVMCQNVTI